MSSRGDFLSCPSLADPGDAAVLPSVWSSVPSSLVGANREPTNSLPPTGNQLLTPSALGQLDARADKPHHPRRASVATHKPHSSTSCLFAPRRPPSHACTGHPPSVLSNSIWAGIKAVVLTTFGEISSLLQRVARIQSSQDVKGQGPPPSNNLITRQHVQ